MVPKLGGGTAFEQIDLRVVIRKGEMGFGFNIVGGEDGEPVYITRVAPGGAADQTGNIRMVKTNCDHRKTNIDFPKGDVLLRVNDVDLSMATHGEAAVALKAIPQGAQVKLLLQFRPKEYSEFDERLQQQNYR